VDEGDGLGIEKNGGEGHFEGGHGSEGTLHT
jgi:hypothetical protein